MIEMTKFVLWKSDHRAFWASFVGVLLFWLAMLCWLTSILLDKP